MSARSALLPRPYRVVERYEETADTATLALEAEDGAPLEFAPGQFNMLYAFGRGEAPISLSGDPASPHRLLHTIRAAGPVTEALAGLRPGERLGLRGPYGSRWPVEESEGRDVLVVAGGLGLAPLRPAIYRLLAARERYGRIAILYGARGPDGLLYRAELERLRSRLDLEVEVTVDHADGTWRGDVGVVPSLIPRARFSPGDAVAMVCGPEVMMRFTVAALLERGLGPEQIHLSLERNMKCGVVQCGHCQLGPVLVCRDGPVLPYARLGELLTVHEL
ncbi:MAG: FAD/NAD(P)-binding protein [Myxococcales bacterium]